MGDDYDPAEEETAFEKWVGDHLGKKAEDILLAAAAVVGGLFAILLFTVLPTVLVGGLNHLVPLGRWAKVVLEAVLKVRHLPDLHGRYLPDEGDPPGL